MKTWKETNERYIAFIDIMGFSNFVYRNTHQTVKNRMDLFQKIIYQKEKDIQNISRAIDKFKEAIKTVIFSDSILVFSIDDSIGSLENILFASQLILTSCIDAKIPIKGAISCGKLTADFNRSLYFGKGLIDAYTLENVVEMYGIVLDEKVERKILKYNFDAKGYCCTKKIPTKVGLIRHIAIDWIHWAKVSKKDPQKMIETFYCDASGQPRKYIDNTIDFINTPELSSSMLKNQKNEKKDKTT